MQTDNITPQPQIVWEKWVDPFGDNIEDTQWTNYDYEEQESDLLNDQQELFKNKSKPIKVISSPMGLIPYNEHTSSAKIFNFWIGHTNFNLSQEVVDIIENCNGIEILDIFTRYRFRIAVGKCFNDSLVMQEIKNTIFDHLSSKE
jgi:hypothetical protein